MKKKIIIIGPLPPPFYGVANATQIILNSLPKDDFDVLHLDTSDHRPSLNFGKFDFQNVHLAVKHILILLLMVLRHKPHLIYIPISQGAGGYVRDALFILIGHIFQKEIVLHLRGANFKNFHDQTNFAVRWLIRKTIPMASKAIVLGESLKNIFRDFLPDERICVVPNGVNPADFKLADLANRRNGKIRIVFLSNLHPGKGYFELLQAISLLAPKYDIFCQFAGSWNNEEDEKAAQTYISENSLQDVVSFVGIVKGKDKQNLLADSDIFVLPTYFKNEGQPWSILEAMASGLPIIATDHGCIKETVVNGSNGFLIEKNDVDDLVENLQHLIKDKNLRLKMGKESRTLVIERFNQENFIRGLSNILLEI